MKKMKQEELLDYCKKMSMSYSYKPVLILALLKNNGAVTLDEAANFFLGFYGKRLELGLVAEKNNSIYSNLKCTFELVKQNIRQNPVRALTSSSSLFLYNVKTETLYIIPEYYSRLTLTDIECIVAICIERLNKYYSAITLARMNDITCFSNPEDVNGFLSNDYDATFSLHGERFMNVTQYLLYRKAALVGDELAMHEILSIRDKKKNEVSKVVLPNELESFWMGQRQLIAYQGLIAKFVQNSKLGEELLDTGSTLIAACIPRDAIWGIGLEIGDNLVSKAEMWPGQNILGFTLMQVRNALWSTRRF